MVPVEQIVTPMPYTTNHLYVLYKNKPYQCDIVVGIAVSTVGESSIKSTLLK